MNSPAVISGLLEAVAAGDRAAFRELYSATASKLFGVIIRIVRRKELAEEILQETFITVWEKSPSFDCTKGTAIAWLCTIARNRALDHVRRRGLPLSPAPLEDHIIADGAASPLAETELREELLRLEDCLEDLDAKHASAIRLAYLDGASREELAHHFGVPEGTIKTWLRRNLIKLKDCLGHE